MTLYPHNLNGFVICYRSDSFPSYVKSDRNLFLCAYEGTGDKGNYICIYIYRVQLLRSDKWLQMIQMKVHFAIEGLCLIVISIFSSIEGIIDFSNFPLSKGTHIIIPHVPCDLK